MNIIDLKFEALSIFTRLETQLACLQMRLPVPDYDGGTYNTTSPTTEPFTYWKSYLVREAFYQMFRHTDEITVFCQMLEWLDERNDEESLTDGLNAVKRIQQLVENKMRDEIIKENGYKMEFLTQDAARLRLIEYADEISSIASYSDLVSLDPKVIGSMIEYEYISVTTIENSDALIEGNFSGHHRDTLNLLHSAYMKRPWAGASKGTIFEFDEDGSLDEFYITELQEALIASESITASGARVLFGT